MVALNHPAPTFRSRSKLIAAACYTEDYQTVISEDKVIPAAASSLGIYIAVGYVYSIRLSASIIGDKWSLLEFHGSESINKC